MRRLLPLVAPLALALSCSGPTTRLRAGGSGPLDDRALVVYPYAFGWEEPAFRSLLKASDAVVAAGARLRLPVIPPTEFEVARPLDPNVLAGSTAARAMAARGLLPRAFLVLRGWAERIGARTVTAATVGGRTASALDDESAVVAHVQITEASTGEVVVEATGRTATGEGAPGGDPLPELTALHRRLLAEALAALAPRLPARGAAAAGPVAGIPAEAFESWAQPGRSSLKDLATRDPIAAAAARAEIAAYRAAQRER